MNPTVSILIPARNEEKYIARTLETVFAQNYPTEQIEILVIDGMSTDHTPAIVANLVAGHSNLRLLSNPQRLQSHALNMGIRQARGEYVVRMDAHALYAPDYVRQCVELLQRGDAGEVGGVQQAIGTTYVTHAIALAMGYPFGVGNARFRYTDREIYAETVYLGAWKRATLLEMGGFSNEVNEEGDLNYRLRKAGYKILVSPQIRLQYVVRTSLTELARQYAWYGRARVQTLVKYPESVLYRQLFPPLLLVALLVSGLVCFYSLKIGLIVPLLYFGADVLASAVLSARKGGKYSFVLPLVFAIMHLCYAVGFFAGMFHFGVPRLSLKALWRPIVGGLEDGRP